MPEHGLDWLARKDLLTYEEMMRICRVLIEQGISKIRITGGEPFVRKDIMTFLTELSKVQGLTELTLTTNGVLTAPLVPDLKKLGVRSVNLSLDTIDRDRFFQITRRDELPAVLNTMHELLKHGIEVKINAVVMDGRNTGDIVSLAALTKDLPVSVRYIEEMPFNGSGNEQPAPTWDHVRIMNTVADAYPGMQKIVDAPFSTSSNYLIPGHRGSVGVIAAYTRTFCGSCNRIRITPQGMLKTCLYDNGVLNIGDLVRATPDDANLMKELGNALNNRARDGHEAEKNSVHESMAAIGG
jgi:molybdenum cofactor biosynthesis enzyme MoaA